MTVMDGDHIPEALLRKSADKASGEVDNAGAAPLSGTRGNHRPDSDRDMAVITRGAGQPREPAAFRDLPVEADALAMPPETQRNLDRPP